MSLTRENDTFRRTKCLSRTDVIIVKLVHNYGAAPRRKRVCPHSDPRLQAVGCCFTDLTVLSIFGRVLIIVHWYGIREDGDLRFNLNRAAVLLKVNRATLSADHHAKNHGTATASVSGLMYLHQLSVRLRIPHCRECG